MFSKIFTNVKMKIHVNINNSNIKCTSICCETIFEEHNKVVYQELTVFLVAGWSQSCKSFLQNGYTVTIWIPDIPVLPESLNKQSPNFWKLQKTYIKAILKSQKTYIKGLPKVKNIFIKALKIILKTSLNRCFNNFWKYDEQSCWTNTL